MIKQTSLSFERKFKVSYFGGKTTGISKCFKTLASATVSAKNYIRRNNEIQRYVYCMIESMIYYQGRLQKRTFIREINNNPK